MALSAEQHALRKGKITASFVPWLMAGDGPKILNTFYELTGSSEYCEEDVSRNWGIYRGSFSETPILDWQERKTNAITRRGEVIDHPRRPYVCCTLDGFRAADDCVLDVKCSNAFTPLEDTQAFYAAQILVQRECVPCANAALLVEHGGAEPVELPLFVDDDFARRMWQRIEQFWFCVETLTPPVHLDRKRIVPPEQWRTIDLDAEGERPNWAGEIEPYLFTWLDTEGPHKVCEQTKAEIKKLLPDDVGRLLGCGVVVARTRANAITIRRKPVT